jgi:cation diffusion facilitator CzcD-associated flavoprotein CzcO
MNRFRAVSAPGALDVAIIGAGPYGLSIAAHLRERGVTFRIFGRPMQYWRTNMPKGMLLKSDGFASNLSDPSGFFTLKRFCLEQGIEYGDEGHPVSLETFAAYGLAFQERLVPEQENKEVVGLDQSPGGYLLQLDDGEKVAALRVVVAVGVGHFDYVPPSLAKLPLEFVSHSSRHHDLEVFRGREIAVIGGGASAVDLAGLLRELDVEVQLVVRRSALQFHSSPPIGKSRSRLQRLRHPRSGIGPGLRARFFTDAPGAFHYLPQTIRVRVVEEFLGPAGGWFTRDKVMGRVPLLLGHAPESAEVQNGKIRLRLRTPRGDEREILLDHIIAATGYRIDLSRLPFLSAQIQARLKSIQKTPILSSNFESSIAGLYFVGPAAANSFGPVMRFAFGAGFTARRLAASLTPPLLRQRTSRLMGRVATS